ncbi:MAG TPA: LPS assembly lipoprotein LptE [Magnetospirillaceae bacterium]|jgi:LPS-assembly lipoprotein
MWWRNALIGAALLALAGCGFHALYGRQSVDPRVQSEMATIYVQPLPDREGQLVRNAILQRLNPNGQPAHARYRLDVKLEVSEAQVALAKDETATRDSVNYVVTFTLYEGDTGLTNGTFSRDFSFDYLNQQYSNVVARSDVQRRAAEEIAIEMRNRMATYFVRAQEAHAAAEGQQPANSNP